MKVFITGGAGYVGHALVPRLLSNGVDVTVYDTLWYGCHLPNDRRLKVIKGDIRDPGIGSLMRGQDAVIHLACISNDSSFELDENLSKTINFDAFEPLVVAAKAAGVKRFVFASTSSVYGISNAPEVTEDHALVPLTLYNQYKAACEPVLFRHMASDFTCVVLRPATLCGYSPRMRLDLAVNALTLGAITDSLIKVYGGSQMRPNLHIEDMVDVYVRSLVWEASDIHGQVFNVSRENRSILSLAQLVKGVVDRELGGSCAMQIEASSDDQRSYRVNSNKLLQTVGYQPRRTIEDAIRDIVRAHRNHLLSDSQTDDRYYNVRRMKRLEVR